MRFPKHIQSPDSERAAQSGHFDLFLSKLDNGIKSWKFWIRFLIFGLVIYIYLSGKLMNVHHDFLTSCLMYKKWRKIVKMTYSASWVRIRCQNRDNSSLKKVIGPQRPISWTNVPRVFYFFSNFSMRNYFFENSSVLKSLDIITTSVKISDVKLF